MAWETLEAWPAPGGKRRRGGIGRGRGRGSGTPVPALGCFWLLGGGRILAALLRLSKAQHRDAFVTAPKRSRERGAKRDFARPPVLFWCVSRRLMGKTTTTTNREREQDRRKEMGNVDVPASIESNKCCSFVGRLVCLLVGLQQEATRKARGFSSSILSGIIPTCRMEKRSRKGTCVGFGDN